MTKNINQLKDLYRSRKDEIEGRMREFQNILDQSDERIFAELSFCICTPQSKATVCWNAINSLMKNRLLYIGDEKKIRPFLNAIRFGETKARRIVEARKLFSENGNLDIKKNILSFNDAYHLREWLVKNVKGLGLKESGHFIRNIGFDYKNQLAILDRHILKNLEEFEIIREIPECLTTKKYLDIEEKMKNFAKEIGLTLYELDLLLWSKETGKVFK